MGRLPRTDPMRITTCYKSLKGAGSGTYKTASGANYLTKREP